MGFDPVGNYDRWCDALAFQQFAHQLERNVSVAAALDQGFENIAFGIDGEPQLEALTLDRRQREWASKFRPEFGCAFRHSLKRNFDTPFG